MPGSPLIALTVAERARAMFLSRLDAIVYAVMVGLGEAYFLADAVRLGASATQIALLVGLPLAVGATGPVLALRLLAALGRRKPVVVAAAVGQALMLLLLAALTREGSTGPNLLIALATAYQVCAQTAGTAWSSWYGDLVPADVRGRYFASRNRGAYAGTLVGLVAAGLILSQLEPARAGVAGAGGGAGFALAYLLAGACRVVSVGLLAASREGRFSGLPSRARVGRFLTTQRGTSAWRLVLMVGLLQLPVQIAAPFFNPFMLEELEFTYVEFMVASASILLLKVLVLPLWGRSIDRHGARRTLLRGAVLLALVPLPWVIAERLWFVVLCQLLSGAAWSGFEVGQFSLLLEVSYRRMRPTIFAAQAMVNGTAQLAGGLLGSLVIANSADPRSVFALSGVLRMAVVVMLIWLLPASTRRLRPQLRVVGFRPGGGLDQRPIYVGDDSPDPTEELAPDDSFVEDEPSERAVGRS
ncbi:MFS transporter [Engelhardtia mirabilis]|uniref:Major Facilitator Superfamily protein n=1 Tax=Engelhardtia mirabilis TaxID=2528011 RepID=A0A518BMF4_9BACT|nr:Major Facilitator Superfamily protein [Planctomycetes bacterium Pla133]QDV02486.1 Major Facilitator Superfamily protein [Planctomycetes bacterium Pla86]